MSVVQEFRDREITRLERSGWVTNKALRRRLEAVGLRPPAEVVDQIGLLTAADAEVHGAAGVEPVDGRDGQEPVVDVVGETEGGEALP